MFYSLEGAELLTYEEKPCTTMRTGMVRFSQEGDYLETCSERKWRPCYRQDYLNKHLDGLIGHWQMDEQSGNEVADNSGYENHGTASGPKPTLSKFTRGRYFNSDGIITVPNSALLNFDVSSFSVCGWLKILDVTYPRSTFGVKKGYECSLEAGWDIGHRYNSYGLNVCIRDKNNKKANGAIVFDDGQKPGQLIGQWVHYVVVFDRKQQKVFVYVNGTKQSTWLDISKVTGSIDNDRSLEFGKIHGWTTNGTIDEYRLYRKALDSNEVNAIYNRLI